MIVTELLGGEVIAHLAQLVAVIARDRRLEVFTAIKMVGNQRLFEVEPLVAPAQHLDYRQIQSRPAAVRPRLGVDPELALAGSLLVGVALRVVMGGMAIRRQVIYFAMITCK